MDKHIIIKEIIYIYNPTIDTIFTKFSKSTRKDLSVSKFIDIISKDSYNLLELGISVATISKLLKEVFPDRLTSSTGSKPCTFLLQEFGYKWCGSCKQVFNTSHFRVNSIQLSGYNTYCSICQDSTTAKTQPFRQKKYQAAKLSRTPSWANLDIIKRIYDCAEGDHVDHIIPLQGDFVCGLHIESNLQYLSAYDNLVKSNNFKTDWE
jgi:hypothetical protein